VHLFYAGPARSCSPLKRLSRSGVPLVLPFSPLSQHKSLLCRLGLARACYSFCVEVSGAGKLQFLVFFRSFVTPPLTLKHFSADCGSPRHDFFFFPLVALLRGLIGRGRPLVLYIKFHVPSRCWTEGLIPPVRFRSIPGRPVFSLFLEARPYVAVTSMVAVRLETEDRMTFFPPCRMSFFSFFFSNPAHPLRMFLGLFCYRLSTPLPLSC